jgi:hypothetical protein
MFQLLYKFNRNKAVLTNRIRTHLVVFPLILAAVVVLCGTSSCYTILKHPRVTQLPYDEDPMDVGCLSCHDDIIHPPPRPIRPPPWWLDHEWGNELETVPIRPGLRPDKGKIDDPPHKIPLDPPSGVKIRPGDPVKKDDADNKKEKQDSKDRTIRPKKPKKKKEDG